MKASKEVKKFLSAIGRKGGKARTAQKGQAARNNGKLGGRPSKSATEAQSAS